MKHVAIAVLLALSGCGRAAAGETEVLAAALAAVSPGWRRDELCLHHTLIERQNVEDVAGVMIPEPVPNGFSEVDTPPDPDRDLLDQKPVPTMIAERWPISDRDREVCLEATIPTIRGDRALVSLSLVGARYNYWLRRVNDEWRVVARTFDRGDI